MRTYAKTISIAVAMTAAFAVPTSFTPAAAAGPVEPSTLQEAVAALRVAEEDRSGYDRDLFHHWIDEDHDGCLTRAEVLISEAVMAPAVGERCAITGGQWYSYYDDVYVTGTRGLDIDHLVPLAEAWDSGAKDWDKATRQAYANDLGHQVPLIAVTAKSNRSKADQDPSTWMPPAAASHCRYIYEWVSTKTRWGLTVDEAERTVLVSAAEACPGAIVDIPLAG